MTIDWVIDQKIAKVFPDYPEMVVVATRKSSGKTDMLLLADYENNKDKYENPQHHPVKALAKDGLDVSFLGFHQRRVITPKRLPWQDYGPPSDPGVHTDGSTYEVLTLVPRPPEKQVEDVMAAAAREAARGDSGGDQLADLWELLETLTSVVQVLVGKLGAGEVLNELTPRQKATYGRLAARHQKRRQLFDDAASLAEKIRKRQPTTEEEWAKVKHKA